MKNGLFLCAIGALLLASCANDDLVVKPVANGNDKPISFRMKVGNLSRATALETEYDNFGVWAFKSKTSGADMLASDLTDLTTNKFAVMPNYLVNYDNINAVWDYESVTNQYLKYWDGSYTNTYFFGYGPHWSKRGTSADVTLAFADDEATMTFPTYTISTDQDWNFIYSNVQCETNSTHITAPGTPVPLEFHRVFSQVQIAVYEAIAGYTVEMVGIDFDATKADNTPTTALGSTFGVAAIPADYDASATPKYSAGKYLNSATPSVIYPYASSAFAAPVLSYTNCGMSTTGDYASYFNFVIPTGDLKTTYTDAKANPFATKYNVIPNTAAPTSMATGHTYAANSGLQFVMNFKLKSEDTGEEITVKGARVYVDRTYTAWQPDKIYTYVFRITKDATGTTTGTDPDPDPVDPDPALYPIVFAGLTIADLTPGLTEKDEWDINLDPDESLTNPHDPEDH